MAGVIESSRRPLKPAEVRFLQAKITSVSARGRRTARVYLPITAALTFVLWLVTILVSDAPWLVISAFWLAVGVVLVIWVGRDAKRDAGYLEALVKGLESALRRNAADVYDVRARAFVEFEEIEDEGACYAFELDDGRVLFISGQAFYPGAKFPSLDFSLVYFLDESDQTVDMQIEKRGPKAAAQRLIPAMIKRSLEIPGHLEARPGRIARLEDHLERSPSSEVK